MRRNNRENMHLLTPASYLSATTKAYHDTFSHLESRVLFEGHCNCPLARIEVRERMLGVGFLNATSIRAHIGQFRPFLSDILPIIFLGLLEHGLGQWLMLVSFRLMAMISYGQDRNVEGEGASSCMCVALLKSIFSPFRIQCAQASQKYVHFLFAM